MLRCNVARLSQDAPSSPSNRLAPTLAFRFSSNRLTPVPCPYPGCVALEIGVERAPTTPSRDGINDGPLDRARDAMSDRARIRGDFIRLLFAVAISVGFAAVLGQMDWLKNGAFPSLSESEQLAILATGMFATVLSWDGYLASIEKKPLNGYFRYAIDIVLVFVYMFFLISSNHPNFWLPILATIFLLYVVWDLLTIREHMAQYNASLVPKGAEATYRASAGQVLRVYVDGFLDRSAVYRGPIISLSWAIYFVGLTGINLMEAKWQVFVTSAFAIAGLALYRRDKSQLFSMWQRVLMIALLLSLAALYFCVFRIGTLGQ